MNPRKRITGASRADRARRTLRPVLLGLAGGALLSAAPAEASLTRNATGSRNMGEEGRVTADTAAEGERDSDVRSWVFEAAVQAQLSDRLQILIEAVPFVNEDRGVGGSASGVGDTELTLSWLALEGTEILPPIVLAAKVKLPTAGNDAIGTGKADYSALVVLGREFGELELFLEAEVATFGSPSGRKLEDQWIYTLGAEFGLLEFLAVYAEAFGNSAPAAGESRSDAALVGLEADVSLGGRAAPYVSVEIDTESVFTARAGVEWTW